MYAPPVFAQLPRGRRLLVGVSALLIALQSGCLPTTTSSDANPDASIDAAPNVVAVDAPTYLKSYRVDGWETQVIDAASTTDGRQYLLARITRSVDGRASFERRIAVVRTDPFGNVVWARSYSDGIATGGELEAVVDVAAARNGQIWVAGTAHGTARVLRLSANGEVEAHFDYGSREVPVGLARIVARTPGTSESASGFIGERAVPGGFDRVGTSGTNPASLDGRSARSGSLAGGLLHAQRSARAATAVRIHADIGNSDRSGLARHPWNGPASLRRERVLLWSTARTRRNSPPTARVTAWSTQADDDVVGVPRCARWQPVNDQAD